MADHETSSGHMRERAAGADDTTTGGASARPGRATTSHARPDTAAVERELARLHEGTARIIAALPPPAPLPPDHVLAAWCSDACQALGPFGVLTAIQHQVHALAAADDLERAYDLAAPLLASHPHALHLVDSLHPELDVFNWLDHHPCTTRAELDTDDLAAVLIGVASRRAPALLEELWDLHETLGVLLTTLRPGYEADRSEVFPPDLAVPPEWRAWPTTVDVSFKLWPGSCVYQGLYDEYRRDTFAAAARTALSPDERAVHCRYTVSAPGIADPGGWTVEWPLLRRGGADGFEPVDLAGGATPWGLQVEDTLVKLWWDARGPWTDRGAYRLKVAGRTREEAAATWLTIARWLRPTARATVAQQREERRLRRAQEEAAARRWADEAPMRAAEEERRARTRLAELRVRVAEDRDRPTSGVNALIGRACRAAELRRLEERFGETPAPENREPGAGDAGR